MHKPSMSDLRGAAGMAAHPTLWLGALCGVTWVLVAITLPARVSAGLLGLLCLLSWMPTAAVAATLPPLPPLREASLLLSRVTWLIRALGSALVIGSTALCGAYVGSDFSHATRASDREKLLVETLKTPVEIAGIFLGLGVAICLAIDLMRAGDTDRRDAISRLIPVVGASAVSPGSGAIKAQKVAVRVLDDLTAPPWTFLIAWFLPGGIFLLAVALIGE